MSVLTQFEKDVLAMLLAGDHPTLSILRDQVERADVAGRQLTGVGFYTDLAIPEACPAIPSGSEFTISDVYADIPEIYGGVGFVLFIRGGYASFLEGSTFVGPWAAAFPPTTYRLAYAAELRSLPSWD